jgi:hypothetical protein
LALAYSLFMLCTPVDVNNGFSGAQGRLFKILKTLIFSSTNLLENCKTLEITLKLS